MKYLLVITTWGMGSIEIEPKLATHEFSSISTCSRVAESLVLKRLEQVAQAREMGKRVLWSVVCTKR